MDKKKKIIISVVAVVVILALAGAGYYYKKNNIGRKSAQQKVEKFIKDNGAEATVKSISKEGGLYKIVVDLNGQSIDTYLSVDGKKFFPNPAIDLDAQQQKIADAKKAKADAENNRPKNDKPKVDLYVMSFCPYGNKAEDTLKSVYNLLKNKVEFNFHYIVTTNGKEVSSLHGPKEVAQNEREACVLKDYGKDKWMDFTTYVNTNCGSDGACWEAGAKSLGLNTAKISSCVTNNGLALMQASEKASGDAGAEGSPNLVINGVSTDAVYQYGNSESYKQAICGAFINAPAECSQKLSSEVSVNEGGSCPV